ncbi:MAG: tRNA1(Val) (adenine(37)-N6)-methyltransferase [Pseudorhodoplanes sp.]
MSVNCVPMGTEQATSETSVDAALGGRLQLMQPRRGHRFGHDAILLAALVDAKPGQHAVDFGAGIGAAGLALAARVPDLNVTLIEIEPTLAAFAADNIARNDLKDRVRAITLDVGVPPSLFASAGLPAGAVDHVLMNPPFNDPARQLSSPDAARRRAHMAAPETLASWTRAATRILRSHGSLNLIWRAEELAMVLDSLSGAFGAVTVLPVHPRAGQPALRVLVRAIKGSKAPLAILPGLILATDRGPSKDAEAILRAGRSIDAIQQDGAKNATARDKPST